MAVVEELWDRQTFEARLRQEGRERYHDRHPFHQRMHNGALTPAEIRRWVANRFHYQRHLPLKDAAILSGCPDLEVRRIWRQRLVDQDGTGPGSGGIEAWLRLAEAVGLSREETLEGRHVLPGVRFAVDAYLNLARAAPWPVAVASSLTELFAPDLMAERAAAFRKHYSWVPAWGLEYFEGRPSQARRDADQGLELTMVHCNSPSLQRAAVAALALKCDILWALLDAVALGHGPGQPGVRS